MAITFRRNAQKPNALRQSHFGANAAAILPIIVGTHDTRASFNLRHHIICWIALLSVGLLYLHIGHRISFEPVALYNPRLFWRSLAAEVSTAITKFALWCHSICERFQV